MKYESTLIAVTDMEKSKAFYLDVLEQRIAMDLGANVVFQSGLALQSGFAGMVNVEESSMVYRAHSMELYFEEQHFDQAYAKLKEIKDLEWVHDLKEYPWGQRVIRIYDPDGHMVEIGESMEMVVKRFLQSGMSVEETSKRSMFPIPFIMQCQKQLEENG